jgi:hypothetical protein
MILKTLGVCIAVAGAGMIAAGAGVASAAAANPTLASVSHMQPPPMHDPHCTRDGLWHDHPGDMGRMDPRCHRW